MVASKNMTVKCEKSCHDKIKNWIKADNFKIGLVIGQSLKESDCIIHVAELSPRTNGYDGDSETDKTKPTCLNDVECKHVSNHVGQAIRMLPGGLDVQGIFVICNSTVLYSASNEALIRDFLLAIHEATYRYYLNKEDCPSRKLLLYGCTKTNKIGVKTFSVTDSNSKFTAHDIISDKVTWLEINYIYSVDRQYYLPKDSNAQSLVKDEKALLEPLRSSLSTGVILIDGRILCDFEILNEKHESAKRMNKHSFNNYGVPKYMKAEFLENRSSDIEYSKIEESPGYIYTSGYVSGRAYLQNQGTGYEAKNALRTDLMRSLVARWQMHCDSLIEEPPEGPSGPVVHEPPRRVYLEGGGLPISLCDYLFPGNSVVDACQSAFELLGISVSEDNIDDSVEMYPDVDEILVGSRDPSDNEQTTTVMRSIETVKRSNSLQILLAIFIGLFATAASYIFFTR